MFSMLAGSLAAIRSLHISIELNMFHIPCDKKGGEWEEEDRERKRQRTNSDSLNTYRNTYLNDAQKLNPFYLYYVGLLIIMVPLQ